MAVSADQQSALIEAVRAAAKSKILPRFRNLQVADIAVKSRADDLVTVADQEAETDLTEAAHRILPGADVVGEEAVAADPSVLDAVGTSEQVVVIDPVDGTWNFANGLPLFGVILCVVEHGETVFSINYDPVMDDWVRAEKGGGAWFGGEGLDDQRLSIADAPDRSGYVHFGLFPEKVQHRLAPILPQFSRFGPLRCSCHEYRMLARGRVGFSVPAVLNVWDHAAGVLAVQEAGGAACLPDGSPYRPELKGNGGLIVAKSQERLEELRILLGPVLSQRG